MPRLPKQPKTPQPKPPTKAQLWEQFKRLVSAAAREVGVPELAYELSHASTRDLRKSEAWKDFERAWTKLAVSFGFVEAERISRGDDLGVSDVDVVLPLLPGALVDCKYQAHGWHHHTIFERCEAKYLKNPGDYIIMPTKAGGDVGSLTTVRSEVFLGLLRKAHQHQDTKPGSMPCPRCAGGSLFAAGVNSLELVELVCDTCRVPVLLRLCDVPKAVLAQEHSSQIVLLPTEAERIAA